MRRRQSGFTLIEIMVAMGLVSLLSVFVLSLVRSQLNAFEMSSQLGAAQQNARAALDVLELTLRRACSGASQGAIEINVAGGAAATPAACLTVYDGATGSGGRFLGTSETTLSDALEIVYADGAAQTIVSTTSFSGSSKSVQVVDTTGFAAGDYVLLSNYNKAVLTRIAQVSGGSPSPSGTLSFGSLPATPGNSIGLTVDTGTAVLHAHTVAFYVDAPSAMLMFDPDGMAGANHTDAQPLAEGVIDLQLAVGVDTNGDGVIDETPTLPDEWLGNATGEIAGLASPNPAPQLPWDRNTAGPHVRQVRASVVLQTTNQYPGAAAAIVPAEDRLASSYPAATAGAARFRQLRIVVAPRTWNLSE